jgi:hypothetical protein
MRGLPVDRSTRPPRQGTDGGILVRLRLSSISAIVAALVMAVALAAAGLRRVDPAGTGSKADRLDLSVTGTINPQTAYSRLSVGWQIPSAQRMRLASLETGVPSEAGLNEQDEEAEALTALPPRASFEQRFIFEERPPSFDERFARSGMLPDRTPNDVVTELRPQSVQPTQARPPRESARAAVRPPALRLAMATPVPPATASGKRLGVGEAAPDSNVSSDVDSHTAIYDIAAHAVYLPTGKTLEAHSGLGDHLDNPRSINLKGRGPTPPNVYRLALREQLFHGIRAIRLIPADDGKMFGRDGMLAHPYMLGPNGQSNGCVSFSDYAAFLDAYRRGEVDRLVVVEHLATSPGPKAGSGWLADAIGNLFKHADNAPSHGQANDRDAALSYQ